MHSNATKQWIRSNVQTVDICFVCVLKVIFGEPSMGTAQKEEYKIEYHLLAVGRKKKKNYLLSTHTNQPKMHLLSWGDTFAWPFRFTISSIVMPTLANGFKICFCVCPWVKWGAKRRKNPSKFNHFCVDQKMLS